MKKEELIERGLSVDINNKVLDEYGNEYRNEDGEIEHLDVSGDDNFNYVFEDELF
jgi:hypothetical protein